MSEVISTVIAHINNEPISAKLHELSAHKSVELTLSTKLFVWIAPERVPELIAALQSTQPKEIEAIRQARFVTTGDLGRDEE